MKDPGTNSVQLLRMALVLAADRSGMPCDVSVIGEVARTDGAAALADAFLDGLEQQLRCHLAAGIQPSELAPEEQPAHSGQPPERAAEGDMARPADPQADILTVEALVPGGTEGVGTPALAAEPALPDGPEVLGEGRVTSASELNSGPQPEPSRKIIHAEPERWTPPQLTASSPSANTATPPSPAGASVPAPEMSPAAQPAAPALDAIRNEGSALLNTFTRPQGDRPSLQFQGANAKQGQPYRCALTAKPDLKHIVTQVTGPSGVDLQVDSETQEVVGTFADAGDIKLDVEYRFVEDPSS